MPDGGAHMNNGGHNSRMARRDLHVSMRICSSRWDEAAWANQSCITDSMRVQSLSIFESNATSLKPSPAQKLQSAATAEFLFSTPMGSVLALGGIDGVSLRGLLDQVDHGPDHQRALLVRIEPASAAEEIVERVIDLLADTALRLWPLWFTDISFAECRSDTLGRAAARIIARQAAKAVDGLWVETAVAVALNGRKPRVTGVAPAVAQLTRALSRAGLVLILEPAEPDHAPAALVRALEWIAQNAPVAVVASGVRKPPRKETASRKGVAAARPMGI